MAAPTVTESEDSSARLSLVRRSHSETKRVSDLPAAFAAVREITQNMRKLALYQERDDTELSLAHLLLYSPHKQQSAADAGKGEPGSVV